MKQAFVFIRLIGLVAVIGFALSCAKKNDGNGGGGGTPNYTTCQIGYVYHPQYGCQPQGNCPVGQISYNGICQAINNGNCQSGYTYDPQYGCQPPGGCSAGGACQQPYPGNCQPGYPNCMGNNVCPPNMVYYNGWCHPAGVNGGVSGGWAVGGGSGGWSAGVSVGFNAGYSGGYQQQYQCPMPGYVYYPPYGCIWGGNY